MGVILSARRNEKRTITCLLNMIKNIDISNYKSIENISIDLGKINVFIGENGAGKSNILEAIALASAATEEKLENDFLLSRGIRVTESILMTPGFSDDYLKKKIILKVSDENNAISVHELENNFQPYSTWKVNTKYNFTDNHDEDDKKIIEFKKLYEQAIGKADSYEKISIDFDGILKITKLAAKENNEKVLELVLNIMRKTVDNNSNISKVIRNFLIYSAENSTLRDFSKISPITPLGISGEGLFKLIQVEIEKSPDFYKDLVEFLKNFGWFKEIKFSDDISSQDCIKVIDRYINRQNFHIDLRSANEGFLFLIFYFSIFRSSLTPNFFAIDNIDSSLNPRLCTVLTRRLVDLANKNNKQAILTTHNPAILDGLDLRDDNQRLFVISRDLDGKTKIKRFTQKPSKLKDSPPQKLSELFMSGALGGVPKLF